MQISSRLEKMLRPVDTAHRKLSRLRKTETDMDRFEATSMMPAVAEADGLYAAAHKNVARNRRC
jgi:hypothetical protein